jgi:ABC-type Fe3+/spermidine/putrescine transport system ATPase subunit
MRCELQRIQTELNITTVYVTHDQEELLSKSDPVAVMNDGTIEQVSKPADLYTRPANRFVADFIVDTNLLPGTIESVNGEGITIRTEHARIEPFEVPHSATNDDITARSWVEDCW